MSVSALDTPVSVSSRSGISPPGPKAEARASHDAAAFFDSYQAGGNNFRSPHGHHWQMSGAPPHSADRYSHQPSPAMHHPALPHNGMQKPKPWNSWFGGNQHPEHTQHSKPPARPFPGGGSSGPIASNKGYDQMARDLLNDARVITGSRHATTVDIREIQAMAQKPLGWNPAMNKRIKRAQTLMRNPEALKAFDRSSGTGAFDGKIDLKQLSQLARDDNPLKYSNKTEVSKELLSHYEQLKERFGRGEINANYLKKLAAMPLTGNPSDDHLIHLARESTKYSDDMAERDNLASKKGDGRISWHALQVLSRNR